MRPVPDDRLRDRVLWLEVYPSGDLSQREVRVEKLAILLQAMDMEDIA